MPSNKETEEYVTKMLIDNPVRLAQWALLVISKDVVKSNASEVTLSQEIDLWDKRYKSELKILINETNI